MSKYKLYIVYFNLMQVTGKDMCAIARQLCNQLESEKHNFKPPIEQKAIYGKLKDGGYS